MNSIMQRVGALLALLAILASYGGHWGVLQTVAWSGMVIQYSRDAGLVQGIQDTFDGEHPCSLCTQISEAKRQALPDTELAIPVTHPPVRHFAGVGALLVPPSTKYRSILPAEKFSPDQSLDRPPIPPPRVRA